LEKPELINFDKRRKQATIIGEMKQWQNFSFPEWEERTITDYLSKVEVLTDKALYKYSLICEPKGGREHEKGTLFTTKSLFKKFKFDL